jgi:hypothetical protein
MNHAHVAGTLAAKAQEAMSSADPPPGATAAAMNNLVQAFPLGSDVACTIPPPIVDRMRVHLLQRPNHAIRRVYLAARSDRHLKAGHLASPIRSFRDVVHAEFWTAPALAGRRAGT